MSETLECLRQTDVKYVAGFHCTGYFAQKVLMDHFAVRWISGTVGACITFNGNGA
ncbi:MAG TPA: hypothetical protein VLX12_02685 [Syntrophorhabdales bacterium]|nr:hypothetical protein [Syntrophorhabdales bacterium]